MYKTLRFFRPAIIFSGMLIIVLAFATFTTTTAGERFIDSKKASYTETAMYLWMTIVLLYHFGKKKWHIELFVTDILFCSWIGYDLLSFFLVKGSNHSKFEMYIGGFFLYLSIRQYLPYLSIRTVRKVFTTLLGLVCIMECLVIIAQSLGYYQSATNLFAATGTFSNPAPAALFISTCFPFFLANLVLYRRSWNGMQYISISLVSTICILIGLVFTKSRTSWISIVFSVIYIVNFRYPFVNHLRNKFGRKKFYLLTVAAGLSFLAFLYVLNSSSAATRLLVWKISISKLPEAPLFGFGFGSVNSLYDKWQANYFLNNPAALNSTILGNSAKDMAGWIQTIYNEYFEVMLEGGIIGFVLFVSFLYQSIKNYHRLPIGVKKEALSIYCLLITILISSIFSYPLYSFPTFLLFILSVATLNGSSTQEPVLIIRNNVATSVIYAGIILPIFIYSSFVFAQRIQAFDKYIDAFSLNSNGFYADAVNVYNQDTALINDQYFLVDYAIALSNSNRNSQAIHYFEEAKKKDNDIRIYMMLGNLLSTSDPKEAEKNLKIATAIAPALVYPKYELLKYYTSKNDTSHINQVAEQIIHTKIKVKNPLSDMILDSTLVIKRRYK